MSSFYTSISIGISVLFLGCTKEKENCFLLNEFNFSGGLFEGVFNRPMSDDPLGLNRTFKMEFPQFKNWRLATFWNSPPPSREEFYLINPATRIPLRKMSSFCSKSQTKTKNVLFSFQVQPDMYAKLTALASQNNKLIFLVNDGILIYGNVEYWNHFGAIKLSVDEKTGNAALEQLNKLMNE